MNERRRFLKIVAAGPAGALLVPLLAESGPGTLFADVECVAGELGRLPENVIYTRERQGVWKGKAGSHVPLVDVERRDGKVVLKVETQHGMSEGHYIVRHTVVSGEGKVLGAKTFKWTDEPVSTHEIEIPGSEKGRELFVTSFCSLHDLWLLHTHLKV